MNIVLLEPFFSGSHKKWAQDIENQLTANVTLITLPGRHWKWRMHGGAIELADQYLKKVVHRPDLIIATSMLDLSLFQSLRRKEIHGVKTALYFHENQFSYPWSPDDEDPNLKRDQHYQFIQYSSALSADVCFFNSKYNLDTFIKGCEQFLKKMPDGNHLKYLETIKSKSKILPLH
jgi:hypothetical protein